MVPIGVLVIVQVVVFAVLAFVLKRLVLSDTLKAVAQLRQVEAEVGHKEEAMRRRLEENSNAKTWRPRKSRARRVRRPKRNWPRPGLR